MISRKAIGFALVCAFFFNAPVLAKPTKKNTVLINAAFEIKSLDPTSSGYIFSRMQVVETLLDVDEQGHLQPALATEWTVSEDGLAWDFTIRSSVSFHDGTALTAQIVADNLDRIRARTSELFRAPVSSVETIGSDKVRIHLTKAYRPLGAILAHYSSVIISPKAFDQEGDVSALIGTGPFSLYSISIPHKLVVEKFDPYWGETAEIEYATYLTGHRAEARVLQARSGQADIIFGLDPASVPMLKRLTHLDIIRSDLPRTLVMKLNAGHPLLADAEIRNALSLSVNRQGIATAILHAPEAATPQLLPSYMADWHINSNSSGYDLAKAAELFTKHGWKKNKDGWLEKDGKPFELTLITYADRPELTTVATAIQDQWKQLGVNLNVSVTNSSAIPSGHQDGSLEVALIARNYGSIADPLGVLMKDFGQVSGGDWGSMNWSNPDIQALLNNLVAESDPTSYHNEAQKVAQAIYDEKPMIAVASYIQQTAVNKRIQGFRFDPYERSYHLNELTWR